MNIENEKPSCAASNPGDEMQHHWQAAFQLRQNKGGVKLQNPISHSYNALTNYLIRTIW